MKQSNAPTRRGFLKGTSRLALSGIVIPFVSCSRKSVPRAAGKARVLSTDVFIASPKQGPAI
ncbi:MAG: hypothetical protein MKZ70_07935, partial [Opitutales bacterium]|nr:hypothetical protein [Opitutales bacterium]